MAVELHPHQQLAVDRLENGKVLWGGVGVGKSITAAAYYMQKEAPKDVYVITTAKKRDSLDWEKEFVQFGVYKQRDATVAGVLTVDSWNNLGKYTHIHGAFFVFDEQRLVGSGAWTKAFLHIAKSNNWILLSATPGDTWLDYIPVFVANGFYKNRTAFKREHVIYNTYSKFPKVDRYVGVNKLVKLKNHVLVEMPYERHTTRHISYITVDHDKDLLKRVLVDRWHVYEERPIRDVAELFMLMRKVVNKNEHRLEQIRCLMEKHPKLIVFYNFNYELEMLRSLTSTSLEEPKDSSFASIPERSTPSRSQCLVDGNDGPSFPDLKTSQLNDQRLISTSSKKAVTTDTSTTTDGHTSATTPSESSLDSSHGTPPSAVIAEWNGHKHEPIPNSDRWVYLVQYVAGSEGWNCTETDAMVFFSLTYSYKNWWQAFGRIDRLNTPYKDLYYYVLKTNSVIDAAIMKSLKLKKNFNERSMAGQIKF